MLQELGQLKEQEKELKRELGKVQDRIKEIQKECKHQNSFQIPGPEPSMVDVICPDCTKIW